MYFAFQHYSNLPITKWCRVPVSRKQEFILAAITHYTVHLFKVVNVYYNSPHLSYHTTDVSFASPTGSHCTTQVRVWLYEMRNLRFFKHCYQWHTYLYTTAFVLHKLVGNANSAASSTGIAQICTNSYCLAKPTVN